MKSQRIFTWFALLMLPCVSQGQEKGYINTFDSLFTQRHHAKHIALKGKMNMDAIACKDTLLHHFSKLDTVSDEKEWYIVDAIWNTDTVTCAIYKPVIYSRDLIEDKIPLIDAYSRYGNIRYLDRSLLPIAKAYTITVYTLNKELFNLN